MLFPDSSVPPLLVAAPGVGEDVLLLVVGLVFSLVGGALAGDVKGVARRAYARGQAAEQEAAARSVRPARPAARVR